MVTVKTGGAIAEPPEKKRRVVVPTGRDVWGDAEKLIEVDPDISWQWDIRKWRSRP